MKKYFLFLPIIFLLSACASNSLKITSKPEKAEVWLAAENEQPVKLGETPLFLDSKSLRTNNSSHFNIKIQKDGYLPESMVLPSSSVNGAVDLSVILTESKLPQVCTDQAGSLEKVARGVAKVQLLLGRGQSEEARLQISSLISEFPNVSVFHDLLGNIHYISKNFESAKLAYQKSLELNPNNIDTQRVLDKLNVILNNRLPASQGGQ